MEIINRIPRMVSTARELRAEGSRIGLIPTGGGLHEGHLSLMTRAQELCDSVIVSILAKSTIDDAGFDLARDAELAFVRGVDLVFAPTIDDMFDDDFATSVTVEGLSEKLEGLSRPQHYREALTAINKLFNIVRPHFSFFGRKNAQQLLLIKRMVRDLAMDVELVVCPTVREEDGLALSAVNANLSTDERKSATVLRRALERCRSLYNGGERDTSRLIVTMRSILEGEKLARVEYIAITDTDRLEHLSTVSSVGPTLVSIAAYIGETRLTDNILLNGEL